MSGQAHVHSLEAVETVRGTLVSFVDQVQQSLETLEVEMRRMLDWLEHDRPAYWKRQIRLAIDEVNEAQAALHHCLMFPIGDRRPSCREERAALKRAQDRLVYCQRKAERVKHWVNVIRHELFEYRGRMSRLARVVEIDGPYAIGVLDKIRDHILEYQAVPRGGARASYEALALAEALWRKPEGDPPLPVGEGRGEGASPSRADQGEEAPAPRADLDEAGD